MLFARRAGFAVVFVLALTMGACGTPSKPYWRRSEPVQGAADSRWRAASVSIQYTPERKYAKSTRAEEITFRLHLDPGPGERVVTLGKFWGGAGVGGAHPEFRTMLEPDFALQFAPDRPALGVSVDGGRTYRLVALDGDEPLYCTHHGFSLGEGWSGAPKTQQLVLEILASADPPASDAKLHLVPGESVRDREPFLREFAAARAYACAHPEHAELRAALVQALVRRGDQIAIDEAMVPLVNCVASIACEHPGERTLLHDALTGERSAWLAARPPRSKPRWRRRSGACLRWRRARNTPWSAPGRAVRPSGTPGPWRT